jgi:hypothetical protein
MKKTTVFILLIGIIFLISFNTYAYQTDIYFDKSYGDLELNLNPRSTTPGYSTEYKLPLDTLVFKANFNEYIFKDWADYYSLTIGSNIIGTKTRNTKTINYIDNINNKVNTITNETNYQTFYLDILLANYLLEYSTPEKTYLILIGYEYENSVYSLTEGSIYDYSTSTTTNLNGEITDLDFQNHLVYLGMIFNKNITRTLKNKFVVKYSPYAYTKNSETNYYQNYQSKGSNQGSYMYVSDNIRYNLTKNMYLTGGLSYKLLNTTGDTERYYYGGANQGSTVNVDQELKSEQYSINVGFQYLF